MKHLARTNRTIRLSGFRLVAATALLSCIALASGQRLPGGFAEHRQRLDDGAYVHYVKGGHGDAVLMIHGFGETARMWRPILSVLGKNHTVITPDLPGLDGSSFMAAGSYDMTAVARRLHKLIRKLGFTNIDVVGHDIGLMAAYSYAALYPGEVHKLILIDAPIPGIGEIWPKIFNNPALWHFHFPDSPIALKLVKGRERTFLDHFWISFSGNPKAIAIPESERETYARIYARPGAMNAALSYFKAFPLDALQNKRFESQAKLPMPVLTIEGERGMGGALKIQAADVASNVRSVILKSAGHWLMEERHVQLRDAISAFLNE